MRFSSSFFKQRRLWRGMDVAVETGTQTGIHLNRWCTLFPEVHTIEADEAKHRVAVAHLAAQKHVTCHLGRSQDVLARIIDPGAVAYHSAD